MLAGFKDTYDKSLEFNLVTAENWLLPDRKCYPPFGVIEGAWLPPFLEPRLDGVVPTNIVKYFEVARGTLIYSWFFYPLATVAFDQCTRVLELAVRERCNPVKSRFSFNDGIRRLSEKGVISLEIEQRLHSVRLLRNARSHLNGYVLLDPLDCLTFLSSTADLVNAIFRP